MRKLMIEIDCKSKTCEECRLVYGTAVGDPFCDWMLKRDSGASNELKKKNWFNFQLSECITVEVKE